MRTFCLEFHAGYRCRHTGACCRAPWEIEVEPAVIAAVRESRLVRLDGGVEPFTPSGAGGMILGRRPDGDCHFHNDARCRLQLAGGAAMLPSACRHFPRVMLLDRRGCLLTLSHYCPTAAALLVDAAGVSIVEAGPPLALGEPLEGLDAREALPPLLRPGMLMDLESYGAFEQRCIATLAEGPDARHSLAHIAEAVEAARSWTPARGSLIERIDAAFDRMPRHAESGRVSTGFEIAASLIGPHPWIRIPPDFAPAWDDAHREGGPWLQAILARYLSAATFGNWMPYRGEGLRTVVEWLRACYDVFRLQIVREMTARGGLTREAVVEAARAADYLVVHTVDSLAFGRAALRYEHGAPLR